jgi:hypothetical protein
VCVQVIERERERERVRLKGISASCLEHALIQILDAVRAFSSARISEEKAYLLV